ncbi:hypothetical protein [Streptococcus bouchesdurhonensis]|uniref:hypothetical protein n=1 Tax=Streptococcus bouchesdurhonensis TaxID=2954240 RepID=UPI0021C38E2C|nr:hypothetical protein [Streptococcus bouchesdurhonensis]
MKLTKSAQNTRFEVADRTDEVSSKHSFEVADRTDEVSNIYVRQGNVDAVLKRFSKSFKHMQLFLKEYS